MTDDQLATPCRILSLDGGGAKGFYTLGVLREIEAAAGRPLSAVFDLVYGTSTGSIIASLIALGFRVDEIHELYKNNVPEIMKAKLPSDKSAALQRLGDTIFKELKFDSFRMNVGIVSTNWRNETPTIFKSSPSQAHGRTATFAPGFGCTISDAVQASCSAYPFFERKLVTTNDGNIFELVDGGYCANNPTLYAIADATVAMGVALNDLRVISVGVGNYPAPKPSFWMYLAKRYSISLQLLQKTLEINTASMDQLRRLLYKGVRTIRISDTFEQPELATDMFEHDLDKLNQLHQRGAASFATRESDIRSLL